MGVCTGKDVFDADVVHVFLPGNVRSIVVDILNTVCETDKMKSFGVFSISNDEFSGSKAGMEVAKFV